MDANAPPSCTFSWASARTAALINDSLMPVLLLPSTGSQPGPCCVLEQPRGNAPIAHTRSRVNDVRAPVHPDHPVARAISGAKAPWQYAVQAARAARRAGCLAKVGSTPGGTTPT